MKDAVREFSKSLQRFSLLSVIIPREALTIRKRALVNVYIFFSGSLLSTT